MDLLLTPDDPAFETEAVPYYPDEGKLSWDGGPFLGYDARRHLRTLDELDALPVDTLHGFLQTWFFFGLLAEMLGLNEIPGGVHAHALDPTDAQRERTMLYTECISEVDGRKVVSGRKALESGQLMLERTRMVAAVTSGGMPRRLEYLDACLQLVAHQIATPVLAAKLDHRIRYSIAALGELFAVAIETAVFSFKLPVPFRASARPWSYGYLAEGGLVEKQLLDCGWCPSEIEKIRSEVSGLTTMHYISRLRKAGPRRDHTGCHRYRCSAFQIQMLHYQPAHTHPGHDCELVHVAMDDVLRVLQYTDSYPVLAADAHSNHESSLLRRRVHVEPFSEGVPYVAISHVWADGLGNPTSNSLPSCQITRLSRLVAELQHQIDPRWEEEGRPAYRVWVDTLCCPVELEGKDISLQRIADVYRNSTHTLVLDSTLSILPSRGVHPAELLCRILCCSPWMRRLWTFQEGALPRSLYFQFIDGAVSSEDLFEQIYTAAAHDIRFKKLWQDCWIQLCTFARFSQRETWRDPYDNTRDILMKLQWALNSRSVSVPKDEALCVATLLGLDLTRVLSEDSAQRRMAAVWKMVAEMLKGIPPKAIFFVDNPLDVEGFRWAPRSLLAADVEGDQDVDANNPYAERKFHDSWLDLSHRSARFGYDADTKMAELLIRDGKAKGVRGRYAGFRIQIKPYTGLHETVEKEALHSWSDVLPWKAEDSVFLKEESTGDWYRLCDSHFGRMIGRWTPEQVQQWQLKTGQRLCGEMHTGRCAVIRDAKASAGRSTETSAEAGLLVLVEHEGDGELAVRRRLNVIVYRASETDSVVAETMSELAAQLASEAVTVAFLADRSQSSKERLMERMQQLVAEAWDARPGFADAALKTRHFGDVYRDGWVLFAKYFSHRASMSRTPVDQIWLVD